MEMQELPEADRMTTFVLTAAQIGHRVTLYEEAHEIGGQCNMAKRIPGKEEFHETLRYFRVQLRKYGVQVKLRTKVSLDYMLCECPHVDKWVLATGVLPRKPKVPGVDGHPNVISYTDVLLHKVQVGERVAIVGAGGIGFDVAVYLMEHDGTDKTAKDLRPEAFLGHWGIDKEMSNRGGLLSQPNAANSARTRRRLFLLQRKPGKFGQSLGKTTGWIHRSTLMKSNAVEMIGSVAYNHVDEKGNLHIVDDDGKRRILEVDNIVVCAGQKANDCLSIEAENKSAATDLHEKVYTIGGAFEAGELDAKKAIDMGTRLALRIHDKSVVSGQQIIEQQPEAEEILTRTMLRWM